MSEPQKDWFDWLRSGLVPCYCVKEDLDLFKQIVAAFIENDLARLSI